VILENIATPYVLKADAGAGVLIIQDLAEAKEELHMLVGQNLAASSKVVIEEFRLV
jgi:phosphoribosylamine-glycine ligase